MEDNCEIFKDIKESIFSSNSLDSIIPTYIYKQDLRSRISLNTNLMKDGMILKSVCFRWI